MIESNPWVIAIWAGVFLGTFWHEAAKCVVSYLGAVPGLRGNPLVLLVMSSGLSLGPRSIERPADSGHTLVGVLDSLNPAKVDGAGLVQLHEFAWSVDWWVGADDRWYFPSKEATIRQQRLGSGPVLETAMRIPSGDARHRVYAASVGGRQVIVIEVENDSPVPVALGMAIRPYGVCEPVGRDAPKAMNILLTGGAVDGGVVGGGVPGGNARAEPAPSSTKSSSAISDNVVEIDGEAALVLPRSPNEFASSATDVFDLVTSGQELGSVPDSRTQVLTAVALYPLPHRTTLRFVLDARGRVEAEVESNGFADPERLPGPDDVVKGWNTILDRGGRFSFPDPGLSLQVGAARSRILGAGSLLPSMVAELKRGSGKLLEALALSGSIDEVRCCLIELADSFPTRLGGSAKDAAAVVAGIGQGAGLVSEDQELIEALLEPTAQITYLVEKSGDTASAGRAFLGLAQLLLVAGQPDPAASLIARLSLDEERSAGEQNAEGTTSRLDRLRILAEQAASSGSWGDDEVEPAVELWLRARSLLVEDRPAQLRLLPEFPHAWKGGDVEVHKAVTSHGRLSFGIRWHGYRPALLWELDTAGFGNEGVTITCPGLDPGWSTTELRGEALLIGSPEDLPVVPQPGDSFQ